MSEHTHRYAMIMAGGAGTRLWPMSRRKKPKQLLPFIGGRSLLAIAASRLDGVVPVEQRYICTGESFRKPIRDALAEFTDDRILGEPEGRDTVNAVGFTAAVLAKRDPDAVFAVLTADHIIEPENVFADCLKRGMALVEDDPTRLVTFSITPTFAATGYGYLQHGDAIAGFDNAMHVKQFVEKPCREKAEEYLAATTYGWNSGMFVFHARTFLDALRRFLPESHAGLMTIAEAWDTEAQAAVLEHVYPTLPKKSVDYAIMEPASADDRLDICCVTMDVSWMDVGSWPSYGETLQADEAGCRTNARQVHIDSTNVLAVSDDEEHVIATIGCSDLIVIRTEDVTLVCPAAEAQRVKDMAGEAGEELR
jgi:mannose-1-phosphate guanylyltransferase